MGEDYNLIILDLLTFIKQRSDFQVILSKNPLRNPNINPNRNPTINYKRNRTYSGPFRYNKLLELIGVIIRVNEKIMLHYDMDFNLEGYSVFVNDNCQIVYDVNNNWIEFMIQYNDIFLVYNLKNEWIGIII